MRILVLQLARFGDLYQAWPVLRALQRERPEAELHVLARERFRAAADLPGVTVHAMPTKDILEPVILEGAEAGSLTRLTAFLQPLCDLNFDLIVNLSFSPVSSYMTDFIAGAGAEVRGYTRFEDGYLSIPDDTSAYFYAQVGIGRANRYHLADIFAAVAGVTLQECDFEVLRAEKRDVVAVHLGASQAGKTYPAEQWVDVLRELAREFKGRIILIGSADERPLAEKVAKLTGAALENRAGETSLPELFDLIGSARLLIGADSAPIHIASLTGTPVLNLSSQAVNFWETGPTTPGSRILVATEMADIDPGAVQDEAMAMLDGEPAAGPCLERVARLQPYVPRGIEVESFAWRLIEALYTGAPYPVAEIELDLLAFQRLYEVTEVAIQYLWQWEDPKQRQQCATALAHIDRLLAEIPSRNPRIEPVLRWFETQRLRIPPGGEKEILARTQQLFEELLLICSVYRRFAGDGKEREIAAALCRKCVPAMRDYDFNAVQADFQELLSNLHEIARNSTNVRPQGPLWSEVLKELDGALVRRDFVALADWLEWELAPALDVIS